MAMPNEERSASGETPGLARSEKRTSKETTSGHGISWGDAAVAQVRETMTAAIELSADGFLQQINEYECIRDLGVGATAEVKLCRRVDRHTREEELVAVKVFNKSLLNRQARGLAFSRRKKTSKRDSQVLQNVRREVALMKKLVHPNVVRLLEVIDDPQNDLLFMAMEFVHNGPVMVWEEDRGQYVSPATGGVLPPRTAAAYFRGMLDGLEFLHANHVVHRDLKPENVLLTKDGVAKITDFGVAHIFDEQEQSEANGHDVSSEREDPEYRDRHRHQLTQPEGTWCFWAPEICTTSNVAKERAIQAARTRALGAEAAKSMVLGGSTGGETPKTLVPVALRDLTGSMESSTPRTRTNLPSVRHSFRRQGTYNAFAADVWAAGVCLWVFRFGTPPFYDPDPSNLFIDICRQPLHFPDNADEGDEEVIAAEKVAEEKEKEELVRAKAQGEAAAGPVAEKKNAAEEEESRKKALWQQPEQQTMTVLTRESSDMACLHPIKVPEFSPAKEDDDLDLQSPGQLPALGRYSGKKKKKTLPSLRRSDSGSAGLSTFDTSASGPIAQAPPVHPQHSMLSDHRDEDGQRRSLSASAVGGPSTNYGLPMPPEGLSTPPSISSVPNFPPEQQLFRRASRGNRCAGVRSSSVDAPSTSRKPPRGLVGSGTMEGRQRGAGASAKLGNPALEVEGDVRVGGGSGGGTGLGYMRSSSASSSIHEDGVASGPVSWSRCSIEAGRNEFQFDSPARGPTPSPSTGDLGEDADGGMEVGNKFDGPSGTLRDLLTALLNKKVSERITVRGAQEHPWMTRMCPGSGETGSDEAKGALRREPPPQVSVTAGEVKGAIVHINSLFVISMVKSRLTQRLTRARKNIARRRLQATTGEKFGPSLSDTEQDHLREVRDLTEALTKDESVLVHHQLANEPERSLSDSDLPTATYSGAWPTSSHRSRGRGGSRSLGGDGVPASVAHRLYKRSASRLAGRDSVHTAINNFFGENGSRGRHGQRRSSHGRSHHSERRSHGHGEKRNSGRRSGGGGSERRRRSSRSHGHNYSRSGHHGEGREGRRRRSSVSSRHESVTATTATSAPDGESGREPGTPSAAAISAPSHSACQNLEVEDSSTLRSVSARVASSSADADRFDGERERRSRHRHRDKDADREGKRHGHRRGEQDGHKHRERNGERRRSRDEERHRDRDGERHRARDRERHRDRDKERHRDRDRERHRDRDRERHRDRDRERHRDRDKERHRDGEGHEKGDGERYRDQNGGRQRDREVGHHRDSDGRRHRDRDGKQHRDPGGGHQLSQDGERQVERDVESHPDQGTPQNEDWGGEQHRRRANEWQRDRDREQHRDPESERHRDVDNEQHRDQEGERCRDQEGEGQRGLDKEGLRDEDSERHRKRDGERQRNRDAERHRDQNQDQQRSSSLAILSKGAVSGSGRRQRVGSASSDGLTLAPSSSTVGARSSLGVGGSSGCSRNYSRSYSTQSLVSVPGYMSASGSDSGSLSSDFSPSDAEASFPDGSDFERDGVSATRFGVIGSFGSEGSSRSGHSGRSRGSFKVFGITRRTLQLKNMKSVPRMTIPRMRRPNSSGGLSDERDEGSANVTPVKAAKQDSTLGRLSGGVLGKKRLKNGKSSGSGGAEGEGTGAVVIKSESAGVTQGEGCASAPSYVSMASVASVGENSSGGDHSDTVDVNTPGAEWMNSETSSYYRPASRGGTRSAFVTAAVTTPSKPPPGPSLAVAAATRRAHSAATAESNSGMAGASIGGISGASSQVVGARSSRRYRRAKE